MTPEQQRLAIAEWVFENLEFEGYDDKEPKDPNRAAWFCKGSGDFGKSLPDFLNDLNAMHDAEGKLRDEQVNAFESYLNAAISKDCRVCDFSLYASDKLWNATAKHRAEALLRTIGKWVES